MLVKVQKKIDEISGLMIPEIEKALKDAKAPYIAN
jgi:hypothetical protein